MAILASLFLKADAGQARAELRALQGEVTKTSTGAKALGGAALTGATGVDKLGDEADITAQKMRGMAAANDKAALAAKAMAGSNTMAAGSVGNLVAQFNDVGMMMAAGQNPLMLAIQQGTQISQVIGPMGAAGAVKALGAAFVGMLNPVNLIVMGVIAGGAMIVQWLFASGEEAESFEDRLNSLNETITEYRDLITAASASDVSIGENFGTAVGHARELLVLQREMARIDAERSMAATTAGVGVMFKASQDSVTYGNDFATQQLRVLALGDIAKTLGVDLDADQAKIAAVARALNDLGAARGPAEQAVALKAVRAAIDGATDGVGTMTAATYDLYRGMVDAEQAALRLAAASEATERAEQFRQFRKAYEPYVSSRIESEATLNSSNEVVATLNAQASMRALIAQYGRESLQVAEAQLLADRAIEETKVAQLALSAADKLARMEAWDAANGILSPLEQAIDFALQIGAAASVLPGYFAAADGAAAGLAGTLATAAANAWSLAQGRIAAEGALGQMAVEFSPGGQAMKAYGSRGATTPQQKALETRNTAKVIGNIGGGGGGGGGAAREEADAVADLISKLREEAEMLAQLDPVKKELMQYRKVLAEATDAERAEIEQLIAAEVRLNAVREATEWFGSESLNWLQQIAQGGNAAQIVLDSLIQSLLQAVWLGKGPLAGILGISGGIFSGLFGGGAGIAGKADGGMIYGEGGGRDDKVLTWMSAGEYAVNARSTARYRPLLDRINGGHDIPGYAAGGMIGAAPYAGPGGGGGTASGPMQISVDVSGARGDRDIEERVMAGVQAGITMYRREALALDVKAITRSNGRVTG